MRRDRRWAVLPLAVLLGTALTLAPTFAAPAFGLDGDAAGDSVVAVVATDDGTADEVPVGTEDPVETDGAPAEKNLAELLAVGGEVVLEADAELEEPVAVSKDTTLDLAGHKLSGTIQVSGARLTVTDSALVAPEEDAAAESAAVEGTPAVRDVSFVVALMDAAASCVVDEGLGVRVELAPDASGLILCQTTAEGAVTVRPVKLDHHAAVEPTCTEPGTMEYWSCPACEKLYADAEATTELAEEETVIPAAHELVAVEAKAPTCTEAGNVAYWKCATCGELFLDEAATEPITLEETVVPAAGHKLDPAAAVEPTCTTPGTKEHWKCATCGALFLDADAEQPTTEKDLTLATIPHKLEKKDGAPSTCTAHGTPEYWVCTTCQKLVSDAAGTTEVTMDDLALPLAPHDLIRTPEKAATCTEDGNVAYWTCYACGELFLDEDATTPAEPEDTVVAARGHRLNLVPAVAATTEAEGTLEHWECAACGALFLADEGEKPTTADALVTPKLRVFTVTFDDCLAPTENETVKVVEGQAVARPKKDPAAEGYKFEGWYLYEGTWADEPYDFSTPVSANLTLYGKWSEVEDKTTEKPATGQVKPTIPETGDVTDVTTPIVVLAIGVALVVGVIVYRRVTTR